MLINNTTLDTVIFADDQVIISGKENELLKAVHLLEEVVKMRNLKISAKNRNHGLKLEVWSQV
jgi:hypothetical protein